MATILYLSNQLVQVVEAKAKGKTVVVQNIWQGETPEGSLINGIITDEDAFISWIKAFFLKNRLPRKDITLVVNSSQFINKVLEFPKLKDSEIRKMVPREFSENRTENTLFTYFTMDEGVNRKLKIFATAVEKGFLTSYINFFKQAGIEITAIDSGIGCMVRLFMNSPEIHKKTCLIQVLDGREVISILFIKGAYFYSQKNRLFTQDSMEGDMAKELQGITDRILQFASAQQIKEPINLLYLCGNGQSKFQKALENSLIFKGEKVLAINKIVKKRGVEFVYGAGYLLSQRKDNSFIKQLIREQEDVKRRRETIEMILPSTVVIAACLVITAFLGNRYFSGVEELRIHQQNMQDNDLVNASASYDLASTNAASLVAKTEQARSIWQHLLSYPTVNSSVLQILNDCADGGVSIEIRSFQRDSGVLSIDASATDVRTINGFVANLQEQSIFEKVDYSGYTYTSGSNNYSIHVVCSMAEGAGR